MEMVEGKNRPQDIVPSKTYDSLLLMLQLVFHTECNAIVDSWICVLKSLIPLKRKFIFEASLITH